MFLVRQLDTVERYGHYQQWLLLSPPFRTLSGRGRWIVAQVIVHHTIQLRGGLGLFLDAQQASEPT